MCAGFMVVNRRHVLLGFTASLDSVLVALSRNNSARDSRSKDLSHKQRLFWDQNLLQQYKLSVTTPSANPTLKPWLRTVSQHASNYRRILSSKLVAQPVDFPSLCSVHGRSCQLGGMSQTHSSHDFSLSESFW